MGSVKITPILFSAEMIRALLDGRKTQTRRIVAPKYVPFIENLSRRFFEGEWDNQPLPYGMPGDLLWVKETFVLENTREYHGDHKVPTDGRPIHEFDDAEWGEYCLIPHYRATEPEPHIVPYDDDSIDEYDDRTRWTPSIYMKRWASRITLELTGVRVERLQDITEADALAEGVNAGHQISGSIRPFEAEGPAATAKLAFGALWLKINGPDSVAKNPWVWVLEFKAHQMNIDSYIYKQAVA